MAWAKGRFVAAANMELHSSADGASWEKVQLSLTDFIEHLTGGPDGFLAINSRGEVFHSADGRQWQDRGVVNRRLAGLAVGPGRWVGLSALDTGVVLTSTDGRAWSEVDTGVRRELEAIWHDGTQFLAVGEAGTILTSPDGLRWTTAQGRNSIDYYGVAHAGPLTIAAGDAGTPKVRCPTF